MANFSALRIQMVVVKVFDLSQDAVASGFYRGRVGTGTVSVKTETRKCAGSGCRGDAQAGRQCCVGDVEAKSRNTG